MTTQEAINLFNRPGGLRNVTTDELREAVRVAGKTARRRLATAQGDVWRAESHVIKTAAREDPFGTAAINARERGVTFASAKQKAGWERQALTQELKRISNFLDAQTSTSAGFRQWKARQEEALGQEFDSPDQLRRFWEGVNRAKESKAMAQLFDYYDSDQIYKAVAIAVKDRGMASQDAMEDAIDYLNALANVGQRPGSTQAIVDAIDYQEGPPVYYIEDMPIGMDDMPPVPDA